MRSVKIDGLAVKLAFDAAEKRLSDLDWIRSSVLVERAYFSGLAIGLSAIADEDVVSKCFGRFLKRLLWSRGADDTFPSTRLGKDFAALEAALEAAFKEARKAADVGPDRRVEWDKVQQAIETGTKSVDLVVSDVDRLDREWQECTRPARSLLSEIRSALAEFRLPSEEGNTDEDRACNDRMRAVEDFSKLRSHASFLSKMARFIALLETHHEISERLR